MNVKEIYRNYKGYLEKDIEVEAWVRTLRSSKDFGFIEVNDGTFFKSIQIVFDKELNNFEEIEKTSIGSSLKIKGRLIESPAKGQNFEVKAKEVEILQKADEDYPLQKKRHSFEFLRTIAHLRSRSNTFSAVFRLRSVMSFAIHKFFQEKGFVYAHTPILSASDCEGAGEMFRVTTAEQKDFDNFSKDFFGKKAGLTVSGQLNAEAMCMAFNKVYTFGPTFRAENSNTTRHANEFWMIEPEIAFADLNDNMQLAEEMLKYVINYVRKELPEEMEFFNKFIEPGLNEKLDNVVNQEFKKITYTEAIEILEKSGEKFDYPVKWGIDLQTEHERYICEKKFNAPVFVTDYPKDIKAFYMRLSDDEKTVSAMDLLVPGVGEIIGGSQREDRLDVLKRRMKECNLSEEEYQWYLDLRRYGGVKHAGFGLGFERAIMYMTGMQNIRDVIPFPRTPKNIEF